MGQYRLIRELARGGMGEVWLGVHQGPAGIERLVAIKRIVASSEDDPTMLTLFLDEARIASQLQHANVVQVIDLGQIGQSHYLVMEYLRGMSLARVARRLIERRGRIPAEAAVEIVAEAAKGLGYAHRKRAVDGSPLGIVHRDVSPQNVFVTYEGQVKVLDFGIAKAAGRATRTQTGVMRGRLAYMSPEQALAQPVSAATDVYALGVLLYELLAGERLYGAGTDDVAIIRALASRTEAPSMKRFDYVEPGIAAITERCLATDPSARFADGVALADALGRWLASRPRTETLEELMRASFEDELATLPQSESMPQPSTPSDPYRSLPEFAGGIVTASAVAIDPAGPAQAVPPAQATPAPPQASPAPVALSASEPLRPDELPRKSMAPAVVLATLAMALGAAVWLLRPSEPPPPVVKTDTPPAPKPQPPVVEPTPAPVPKPDPAPPPVAVAPPAEPAPTVDAGKAPEPVAAQPPATPAKAGGTGQLTLDTQPWTQVFLGKRLLGDTPLVDAVVPAGHQRLRLVNPDNGIDTVVEIEIVKGQKTVKRLSL